MRLYHSDVVIPCLMAEDPHIVLLVLRFAGVPWFIPKHLGSEFALLQQNTALSPVEVVLLSSLSKQSQLDADCSAWVDSQAHLLDIAVIWYAHPARSEPQERRKSRSRRSRLAAREIQAPTWLGLTP